MATLQHRLSRSPTKRQPCLSSKPVTLQRFCCLYEGTLLSLWHTCSLNPAVEMNWLTPIFFCRCLSPNWPSLSFTGCAVCRKSGARQVCSESSCQTFRINSLFSIPPTARHTVLCEISSRKQQSLSMLPLLLLNSFGWLERDRTRSAHARGLPVLPRQLFSGPKHHFCSEQITEGAQLDFPKDIAKAHKA